MKRKCIYVFTLLSLIGCTSKETVKNERVVPIKVQTINEENNFQENKFIGTVEESATISLSFPITGNLQKLTAQEGKSVRQGDVLATINPTTYQNAYSAEQSSLLQAQDAYKRMKGLYDKGSLAEIKFVDIQTKLKQAEAMEQMAKKNLDDCVLYAPASGFISECSVKPGQNVIPGMSIIKLVQTDYVYVKISVPEKEVLSIRTGQKLSFTVNALNNKEFSASVDNKGIVANPLSHSYDVKLKIANPLQELLPGMVCQVTKNNQTKDNNSIILIPQQAIEIKCGVGHFVWVVQDGKAHIIEVKIGQLTNNGVTITDGLKPGDKVIIEGQNKVSEGTKIKEL